MFSLRNILSTFELCIHLYLWQHISDEHVLCSFIRCDCSFFFPSSCCFVHFAMTIMSIQNFIRNKKSIFVVLLKYDLWACKLIWESFQICVSLRINFVSFIVFVLCWNEMKIEKRKKHSIYAVIWSKSEIKFSSMNEPVSKIAIEIYVRSTFPVDVPSENDIFKWFKITVTLKNADVKIIIKRPPSNEQKFRFFFPLLGWYLICVQPKAAILMVYLDQCRTFFVLFTHLGDHQLIFSTHKLHFISGPFFVAFILSQFFFRFAFSLKWSRDWCVDIHFGCVFIIIFILLCWLLLP